MQIALIGMAYLCQIAGLLLAFVAGVVAEDDEEEWEDKWRGLLAYSVLALVLTVGGSLVLQAVSRAGTAGGLL